MRLRLKMRLRSILVLVILSGLLMSVFVWIARTGADINKVLGDFYVRGGINEGWEQMHEKWLADHEGSERHVDPALPDSPSRSGQAPPHNRNDNAQAPGPSSVSSQ